jgi:hypothetical protein
MNRFRPLIESLEAKLVMSTFGPTAPAHARAGEALTADAIAARVAAIQESHVAGRQARADPAATARATPAAKKPDHGYLVFRITNPSIFNNHFVPPFGHVYAAVKPPVPGQVYNILALTVRNGTAQTFDASSGFEVKFPGGHAVPILTGDQQWKAGQNYIFYVLTKEYYPIRNQVTQGFTFNLGGARSIAIPGPSGIFLRIRYDPATINRILDYAITSGPGIQGGVGHKTGMADTAINEFVSARTNRNDFGGYF